MEVIAHIFNDLDTKFGIPRQSGVAPSLRGRIVFEKEYRVREAFRGLEEFSHIWLLWDFSEAHKEKWSPTVRPPRLGGNQRMGVFATRSPFRPNNIGLSVVRLVAIDYEAADGPALIVEGIDMMNMTPIYDIKPYLPYADAIADASAGFVANSGDEMFAMDVELSDAVVGKLTEQQAIALREILSNDPRPHYHSSAERIYKMRYAGIDISFRIEGRKVIVV